MRAAAALDGGGRPPQQVTELGNGEGLSSRSCQAPQAGQRTSLPAGVGDISEMIEGIRIGESVGSPFAPRKHATFAERKATLGRLPSGVFPT